MKAKKNLHQPWKIILTALVGLISVLLATVSTVQATDTSSSGVTEPTTEDLLQRVAPQLANNPSLQNQFTIVRNGSAISIFVKDSAPQGFAVSLLSASASGGRTGVTFPNGWTKPWDFNVYISAADLNRSVRMLNLGVAIPYFGQVIGAVEAWQGKTAHFKYGRVMVWRAGAYQYWYYQ
ncbi:hypothetical protein [Schleiferilactobacillus shenzhenensis]|uniref:Uncharacterized protein n=1 Tax=Schleiferilactobacillus shenzhenensis LY-73 TaxID=1231336 RepID=U4TLJ4_9LACO|nr:hypothetical protein [Schleiferilactobacillus shenzhenensis]ERL65736.1 hypothetical protein L248_2422 [Schleiferilactobacillus shenzhenensis LY-73]